MASYVSTFTGNGSEVHFTAGFPVLRLSDLAVVVNGTWLTLGVDYSVSGSTSGPLATLAVAPSNGATVTLRSAVGYTPTDPAAPYAVVPTLNATDERLFQWANEEIAKARGANPYTATSDSSTVLATGTTTARTLANRAADMVRPEDFGAVGDATWTGSNWSGTDDTAAIQAAIDSLLPTASTIDGGTITGGGVVRLKSKRYLITSPLKAYTGITLEGTGPTSKLVGPTTFTGTAMVGAYSVSAGYVQAIGLHELAFACPKSGVWAFDAAYPWGGAATPTSFNFSKIRNVYLYTNGGLRLRGYAGNNFVDGVFSFGAADQIIHLQGNWNIIRNVEKSGALTGTSTDPYILLDASTTYVGAGNVLDRICIQGTGSANKTAIRIDNQYRRVSSTQSSGGENVLSNFWVECNPSSGYMLHVTNSSLNIDNLSQISTVTAKIKIATNSIVRVDKYSTDASRTDKFWDMLEVDSTSYLRIEEAETRYGNSVRRLAALPNLDIGRHVCTENLFMNPAPGLLPVTGGRSIPGHNLLKNPSFQAGLWGWGLGGAGFSSYEFVESNVLPGTLMLHGTCAGSIVQLTQSITIAAAQVGLPMTVTARVKITGSGQIAPYFWDGNTVDHPGAQDDIVAADGWADLVAAFTPLTAGTLTVGVIATGTNSSTEVYIDECGLVVGAEPVAAGTRFGSLVVGVNTVGYASAAPTDGTWKVGDRIFKSNPSVGQPKGWICTVAGEPGTWVSEGNL